MAARQYQQFQYTLEKKVVTLFANIPIGASGAVGTLVASQNQGIKSVTRTSAGLYVVTLGDSVQGSVDHYKRVLNIDSNIIVSGGISAVSQFALVADAVSSAGTFTIQYSGPTSSSVTTPVATDPDNGATILLEIVLKNSDI